MEILRPHAWLIGRSSLDLSEPDQLEKRLSILFKDLPEDQKPKALINGALSRKFPSSIILLIMFSQAKVSSPGAKRILLRHSIPMGFLSSTENKALRKK